MSQSVQLCIGVTGMNGAGKTTIAKFLKSFYSVQHFEVRDFLDAERARRHMPEGRESLSTLANILRKEYGPDYIMRSLAAKALEMNFQTPFIIQSIRCMGEVEYLERRFGEAFILIGTDAPIEMRYKRALKRDSQTDREDYERFCRDEALEKVEENPWEQNLSACMTKVKEGFLVWNEDTETTLQMQIRLIARELRLSMY